VVLWVCECVCVSMCVCVCVCVVHDILEKAVEVHSTFKAYSGTIDLIYIYTYMYICVYVQEVLLSFKAYWGQIHIYLYKCIHENVCVCVCMMCV